MLSIIAHNGSRILGGGEIGTALLLSGLQRRGHDVRMLLRDATMAERVRALYDIPTGVQHVGSDLMLHDAVRLAVRLRRVRPDAVILTTFKKVLLAGIATRMARVPYVVQRIVLEGDTPARSVRYRIALRNLVDAIVLNADAMRPAFLAGDARLDASRVITIRDGVSEPHRTLPVGAARVELGIPERAFVIGCAARLATQKRLDRLLRALAMLPEHVHCVIAGEGSIRPSLDSLAAELGIARRVHMTGFRSDVGDVLTALDVFVVSSDREGMANSMLEAMMLGIPVVSTPVSGAHEALDAAPDDPAAGVITTFDEHTLAAAIRALEQDRARLGALGRAARERALRRFGADRFLDDWEDLLLRGSGRGHR